jgi:hypothetical protein
MIPTSRGRISAILVCITGASSAGVVDAECIGFPVEHYLKYADIVFLGTVRNVTALDRSKQIVSVDASRVWKGAVRPSVVLYQAPWVAFDSYAFPNDAIDKQYLVFATRLTARQPEDVTLTEQEDAFAVPTCGGGTSELRDVRDAPRQLGAGRAPR